MSTSRTPHHGRAILVGLLASMAQGCLFNQALYNQRRQDTETALVEDSDPPDSPAEETDETEDTEVVDTDETEDTEVVDTDETEDTEVVDTDETEDTEVVDTDPPAPGWPGVADDWDWQQTTPPDLSGGRSLHVASLYDFLAMPSPDQADLRAATFVLCRVPVGSLSSLDLGTLDASSIGESDPAWFGYRYVDTRDPDVVAIIETVLAEAEAACDGLLLHGVEHHTYPALTLGFDPPTDAEQLTYVESLADRQDSQGWLAVLEVTGLEVYEPSWISTAATRFDGVLLNTCVSSTGCLAWTPFSDAGKPVMHIEYPNFPPTVNAQNSVCSRRGPDYLTIMKPAILDARRATCP